MASIYKFLFGKKKVPVNGTADNFENIDVKKDGGNEDPLSESFEKMECNETSKPSFNDDPKIEIVKPPAQNEKQKPLLEPETKIDEPERKIQKMNPKPTEAKKIPDPEIPFIGKPTLVVVPEPKPGQVLNEADGYSYLVKRMDRVKRFIVLGTEGNSYYATEKERFESNIDCVRDILNEAKGKEDGKLIDTLLTTLEEYSCQGRVAKEDAILNILAACVLFEDDKQIQKKANAKIVKICNIPTKLFKFIDLCQNQINKNRKEAVDPKQLRKRPRKPNETNQATESSEIDVKEPQSKYKKFNKTPSRSSGWGRMRRAGIGAFYKDKNKSANRLLQLTTKYKQRNNWNHKQVLGYCHPKIPDSDDEKSAKELVLAYSTRGYEGFKKKLDMLKKKNGFVDNITSQIENHVEILEKVGTLKPENEEDVKELLAIIKEYGIRGSPEEFTTTYAVVGNEQQSTTENSEHRKQPFQIVREHIPNGFLKHGKVWEALLQDMPMTAMLRNLGRMSSYGLFDNNKENVKIVVDAFTNPQRLKRARIHPVKILIALKAYEQGKSGPADEPRFLFFPQNKKEDKRPKPENPYTWVPNRNITSALDRAFYLSFKQPELQESFKTGKRFMLALDVSGSMTFQGCFGCEQITPAVAATALSMVTWNIEEHVEMVAFGGHLERLERYGLRKDMKLNEAMAAMRKVSFGSTDCSLPMTYATKNKIDVDVFIVYTDSDTGYGRTDPSDALREYRRAMKKPNAKLIVMAMTSNGFTIADPEDKGMLDIVGFDTGVPEMISEFVKQDVA